MIEYIAVIFTLACVYYTIKNKVVAWPLGIVGVSAYLWLFYSIDLYAEVVTQIVFLGQSFYGWYNWMKVGDKPAAPITRLFSEVDTKMVYHITSVVLGATLLVYWLIMALYYNGIITQPSVPIIDSFTTATSLVANYYLAKRYIENWYLWIFVDLIYVGMFFYKEVYLTAGLYLLFFFMAIQGYRKWKGLYDTQTT
jgi:nicotinamide mononucleotide transporter